MKNVKKIMEERHAHAYWYLIFAGICILLPILVPTGDAFNLVQGEFKITGAYQGYHTNSFQLKTLLIWFAAISYMANFSSSSGAKESYMNVLDKKWSGVPMHDLSGLRGFLALAFIVAYFLAVYFSDISLNPGVSVVVHIVMSIILVFTLILRGLTTTSDLFSESSVTISAEIIKQESDRKLKKRFKNIQREIFFYYPRSEIRNSYALLAINAYVKDNAGWLFKKEKQKNSLEH